MGGVIISLQEVIFFKNRNLDMTPFMLGEAASNLYSEAPPTYDLYATVNHYGAVYMGHYIAQIKPPFSLSSRDDAGVLYRMCMGWGRIITWKHLCCHGDQHYSGSDRTLFNVLPWQQHPSFPCGVLHTCRFTMVTITTAILLCVCMCVHACMHAYQIGCCMMMML